MFDTHMLAEEAEYWWENSRERLEFVGTEITWGNFKINFFEKYLWADVRNKKQIEFLKLKQGNMTIMDYAAKFKELSRFFPHYNVLGDEGSKRIKFESGLHLEIKQFIGYQDIRQFFLMVNTCSFYDENICARSPHYKSINDKKRSNQNHGKPYGILDAKGNMSFNRKLLVGREQVGEALLLFSSVSSVNIWVIVLQNVLI